MKLLLVTTLIQIRDYNRNYLTYNDRNLTITLELYIDVINTKSEFFSVLVIKPSFSLNSQLLHSSLTANLQSSRVLLIKTITDSLKQTV